MKKHFVITALIVFCAAGCATAHTRYDFKEEFNFKGEVEKRRELELPEKITLDTVKSLVENSPGVTASYNRVKASVEDTSQASVSPNPKMGVSTENVSLEEPAWQSSMTKLHLSQQLELGGKRSARTQLSKSREKLSRAKHESLLNEKILAATTAFNEIIYVQENTKIQKAIFDAASKLHEVADMKLSEGKISRREFLQFEITLQSARLAYENSDSELQPALAKLTSALGAGASVFTGLEFEGELGPDKKDSIKFLKDIKGSILESSPRIAEAVKAVEASRMILKKEKSKRWPDLTVGIMVSRNESNDRNAVGASLSIPIPIWDANSGAVRAAASRLEAAKCDAEQAMNEVLSEFDMLSSELVTAGRSVNTYESDILPRAKESYEISVAAFEGGRLSYVETLEPLITLLKTRKALLDWRRRFSDTEARIRFIAGR